MKDGIPFGCLYGVLLILIYVYVFPIGLVLFWSGAFPSTGWEWLAALGKSFAYFFAWVLGLVPVFVISMYFGFRDRNISATLKANWPLVLAVIYPLLPNLPGPVDEIIVDGLLIAVQLWFWSKHATMKQQALEAADRANQRRLPPRK